MNAYDEVSASGPTLDPGPIIEALTAAKKEEATAAGTWHPQTISSSDEPEDVV
ncbi:hypothetical protein ACFWSF_40605 [Streptomyces sp. NPDC058611]|uniref:hypothetical protein n=1 Tax=Streptomyces sp. NPDC058611 TaxID=3346554 RepID=UPI0036528D22